MTRVSRILALAMFGSVFFCPPSTRATEERKDKVFGELRPDTALVYLIRKGMFAGGARTQFVYANDQLLAVLDSGTYSFVHVDPGRYLFWTNWTKNRREVDLIPGRVFYLTTFPRFELLSEVEGEALLGEVKAYAIPKDKELRTAEKLLLERYPRALDREERMGKAEIASVPARVRPENPEGLVEVPAYSELTLELLENVTSYLNPTGDRIWLSVSSDLEVGGMVVVKAGTRLEATVRHAAKGESGGVGGNFDIVAPSVLASDGSSIPLLGRLESTGKDRTKASTGALIGTAFATALATGGVGAVGIAFVRGREAFLMAGEEYKAWTGDSHWVNRAGGPALPSLPEASGETVPKNVTAQVLDEVRFVPRKRRRPTDLQIALQSSLALQKVFLTAVGEFVLDEPIAPQMLAMDEERGMWVATFDGWSVVRYTLLVDEETVVPVILDGTLADGSTFTAEPRVRIRLKLKEE